MYSSRMPPALESVLVGVLNPDGWGVGEGRPKPDGELPKAFDRLFRLDPNPNPNGVDEADWEDELLFE